MHAGAIDFHTHYVPREIARLRHPYDAWPRLVVESPACANLYRGEAHYRTIDDRSWSAQRRIADMDAHGIALQVVSPLPVTFAYDFPATAALELARVQNDAIAELVRTRPERFAGLGSVPLQDVDLACAELERAVRELGLIGIEIGSAAGEAGIADPRFEPLWQRAEALDALVFLHPETFPGAARFREHRLIFSVGYPGETGATAAQLLMGGLFARRPRLRFLLAHGGGTLPWLLPRLDATWAVYPELQAASAQPPSQVARGFYCDTLTYDAENLALVVRRIGLARLVMGTDYPAPLMERPPGAVLTATAWDDATRAALARENARRILGR